MRQVFWMCTRFAGALTFFGFRHRRAQSACPREGSALRRLLRPTFRIRLSNSQAPSPGFGRAPDALCRFPSPKNEGSRAPTGAGAEAPHPVAASRLGRSPDRRRSPASDVGRRASRRPAAASSLRRRAALSAALFAPPSASSWQEAIVPPGGAPTPPECVLCVSTPAGAAPARGPELPGAGCRS